MLLFPKAFVGIKGVSLMGMLKGLHKGGELIWGVSLTLMVSNVQLLEFSLDWVLLRLSLVVGERFELSDKLDFESKLSGWILHDDMSMQSISFEGGFSKVFWISYFGEEDEGWMETVVSFVRRLCHNFRLVAQKYLL